MLPLSQMACLYLFDMFSPLSVVLSSSPVPVLPSSLEQVQSNVETCCRHQDQPLLHPSYASHASAAVRRAVKPGHLWLFTPASHSSWQNSLYPSHTIHGWGFRSGVSHTCWSLKQLTPVLCSRTHFSVVLCCKFCPVSCRVSWRIGSFGELGPLIQRIGTTLF